MQLLLKQYGPKQLIWDQKKIVMVIKMVIIVPNVEKNMYDIRWSSKDSSDGMKLPDCEVETLENSYKHPSTVTGLVSNLISPEAIAD